MEQPISFEIYCTEMENIPYYNFLSEKECEIVHERYEEYIKIN